MRERERIQVDNTESNSSQTDSEDKFTEAADDIEESPYKPHRVKQYTVDETSVMGVVDDVTITDSVVAVEVTKLTDGETIVEELEIPETWSWDSKLAAIIDHHDLDAASIEMLEGDEVELTTVNDRWILSDPRDHILESEDEDSEIGKMLRGANGLIGRITAVISILVVATFLITLTLFGVGVLSVIGGILSLLVLAVGALVLIPVFLLFVVGFIVLLKKILS